MGEGRAAARARKAASPARAPHAPAHTLLRVPVDAAGQPRRPHALAPPAAPTARSDRAPSAPLPPQDAAAQHGVDQSAQGASSAEGRRVSDLVASYEQPPVAEQHGTGEHIAAAGELGAHAVQDLIAVFEAKAAEEAAAVRKAQRAGVLGVFAAAVEALAPLFEVRHRAGRAAMRSRPAGAGRGFCCGAGGGRGGCAGLGMHAVLARSQLATCAHLPALPLTLASPVAPPPAQGPKPSSGHKPGIWGWFAAMGTAHHHRSEPEQQQQEEAPAAQPAAAPVVAAAAPSAARRVEVEVLPSREAQRTEQERELQRQRRVELRSQLRCARGVLLHCVLCVKGSVAVGAVAGLAPCPRAEQLQGGT